MFTLFLVFPLFSSFSFPVIIIIRIFFFLFLRLILPNYSTVSPFRVIYVVHKNCTFVKHHPLPFWGKKKIVPPSPFLRGHFPSICHLTHHGRKKGLVTRRRGQRERETRPHWENGSWTRKRRRRRKRDRVASSEPEAMWQNFPTKTCQNHDSLHVRTVAQNFCTPNEV